MKRSVRRLILFSAGVLLAGIVATCGTRVPPEAAQDGPRGSGVAVQGGRLVKGKTGKGFLSSKRGDRVLVPSERAIRREQGTIEMWVAFDEPVSERPEWGALFAAQSEPYPDPRKFSPAALKGLILQYTEHSRKIFFSLGPILDPGKVLTVGGLDWKPGEFHHVAASWGENGMRLYIDGAEVAFNRFTGSLPAMPKDVAVGSYVWDAAAAPSKAVIDDVRISGRQRSSAEIRGAQRGADAAGPDPDTLLLLTFDEQPFLSSGQAVRREVSRTAGTPAAAGGASDVDMQGGRFVDGKYGRGYVTEKPGEMMTLPTAGRIRRERGTIEMWIKHTLPPAGRPEWAPILTAQMEDYSPDNVRGIILTWVESGKNIAFVLGKLGDGRTTLATRGLDWAAGENHHLAASWGENGMALYIDGSKVAHNGYRGTIDALPSRLCVGSYIWELIRRPSHTVIDELRISDVQRTDSEIAATARANRPASTDEHVLLYLSFDTKSDRLPIRLSGSRAFNIFHPGEEIVFRASAESFGDGGGKQVPRLRARRADGRDSEIPGRRTASGWEFGLGRAESPGLHRLEGSVDGVPVENGYYWVADKLPAQDPGTSIFGVSQHEVRSVMDEKFFAAARELGITWLRMPFDWKHIEPERNRFDWELYDRITALARRHGIRLMVSLLWEEGLPSWQGKSQSGTNKYPVTDKKAWVAHVKRVVSRYRDKVDAWDPWNEPNMAGYWYPKPNARDYFEFLRMTYEAVKGAHDKARVVGFGLSAVDLRFYEEGFKLGALRYCDVIGVHPYIFPSTPDAVTDVASLGGLLPFGPPLRTTWIDGIRRLDSTIGKYGGTQRIWITELGQHSAPVPGVLPKGLDVSEEVQAEYLVKFYVYALATGRVDHLFWFSFWGTGGGGGPFSIVNPDGRPKPAAVAYRTTVSALADARFEETENLGTDGLRVFRFDRSGTPVRAMWSTGKPARCVAKPPSGRGKQIVVRTISGRIDSGQSTSEGVSFGVGSEPVFVEGASEVVAR